MVGEAILVMAEHFAESRMWKAFKTKNVKNVLKATRVPHARECFKSRGSYDQVIVYPVCRLSCCVRKVRCVLLGLPDRMRCIRFNLLLVRREYWRGIICH
jgi:hypothetical protein